MIVGYARTSTHDQKFGLADQIEKLTNAGCEKIFDEQTSSVKTRKKLDEILEFVRDGDVLVVSKLDRLARSVIDLWSIIGTLNEKNVTLRILNIALDTSTATGKLMLSLLGAVAEFEREIMIERQKDGIATAQKSGVQFGRKPTARNKVAQIVDLKDKGLGATEIAKELSISRASVYRNWTPAQAPKILKS